MSPTLEASITARKQKKGTAICAKKRVGRERITNLRLFRELLIRVPLFPSLCEYSPKTAFLLITERREQNKTPKHGFGCLCGVVEREKMSDKYVFCFSNVLVKREGGS